VREISQVALGFWGVCFSDFVLISSQLGTGVAFAAFIAEALASAIDTMDGGMEVVADSSTTTRHWVMLAIFPLLGVLTSLRSTASLEPLAAFGNIVFLVSFVIVMVFGFGTAEVSLEGTSAATGIAGLASFFGLSLFAFSAQSECMSVEQFLPKNVQQRYGRVLDVSLMITVGIYILFGVMGYIFFKDSTSDNIFSNLKCGPGEYLPCKTFSLKLSVWLNVVVQLGMAVMIVVNYPFSMFGACQNVEEIIWGCTDGGTPMLNYFAQAKMAVLRVFWVAMTLVVAAVVPDFGFLVGFVGCFCQTLFAFVLPPLFHLSLSWTKLKTERLYANMALHIAVLIFGVIFSVVSTTQLIVQKIDGNN